VLCPENQTCFEGECHQNCNGNECVNAGEFCMPEVNLCLEPCVGVDCAFGQLCNIDTIMCEDPCEGVDCPDPANRCWMGECVPNNCISTGCEDGSVCDGLECVPDPCIAANCPSGEFCREGQCIPSCAQVSCPLYENCQDGFCVPDDCGGVECADGLACRAGACVNDPCAGIACEAEMRCVDGTCLYDDCSGVFCPPGQICGIGPGNVPQCFSVAPEDRPGINPDDPTGSKYLDFVVNAMPAYFAQDSRSTMTLVDGLLDYAAPKSYEVMFKNFDSSQVVLVTGEQDNVYFPGYDEGGGTDVTPTDAWAGLSESGTVTRGAEKRFETPVLPAGDYTFETTGTGDADLYVRVGMAPTNALYDCRPYRTSTNETCSVTLTTPAPVHVMVQGYAATSNYELTGAAK
jgi:hypothetical protein